MRFLCRIEGRVRVRVRARVRNANGVGLVGWMILLQEGYVRARVLWDPALGVE